MMRIGLDVGGTKTELVAIGLDGEELLRRREPTPHGDYQVALASLVRLVLDAEAEMGAACSIGIGMPGTLIPSTGRLTNAYATPYNEQLIKPDLESALGREVRIANDANCFALSEAYDGAARGAAVVFGVILGTGVGGGIVVNGYVVSGANGIAGEWGHNPLARLGDADAPAPTCYCGRTGCVETWLCGPALVRDHHWHTGEALTPLAIAAEAVRGNPCCQATIERYCERAARALAGAINLLDPGVIVLGGGLSNIDALYQCIPEYWRKHVFSNTVATRLVRNRHGDSSGVRGAAWLWPAVG